MRRRSFPIRIVMVLAALAPVGGAIWLLASHRGDSRQSSGLLPLTDPGAFPAEHRSAARAVVDAAAAAGEQPTEFLAEVEVRRSDRMVIFHLWHRSAWEPGNRGVCGNPGGKCRDMYFDSNRGQVVETVFWQ